MNYKQACNILNICHHPFTKKELKKAYYKMALTCHPDLNKHDTTSKVKFQEVADAYSYLCNVNNIDDAENTYKTENNKNNIFKKLIKLATGYDISIKVATNILQTTSSRCIHAWREYIHKADNNTLCFLLKFITSYKDIIQLNDKMKQELYVLAKKRCVDTPTNYILNPALNHLLEPDYYVLTHNNSKIYVPLWHHELIYKTETGTITVTCHPKLPSHISIDPNDTIHIYICISNTALFEKSEIKIPFVKSNLNISTQKIKNNKNNKNIYTHTFSGIGIPKINKECYDISKINSSRGDIKVHVTIK